MLIPVAVGIQMVAGVTPLIDLRLSGKLSKIAISAGNVLGAGAAGNDTITLVDGTGRILFGTSLGMQAAGFVPSIVLNSVNDVDIDFREGVFLVQVFGGTVFTSGVLWVTLYRHRDGGYV